MSAESVCGAARLAAGKMGPLQGASPVLDVAADFEAMCWLEVCSKGWGHSLSLLTMARAELILQELKKCEVTDVIGLPDNSSAALLELLRQDDSIRLHSVTREGEAFALAAGLWVGGKHPLVLIQNTGLLESGDGLRGTLLRMRIPILCLVTYRGYAKTQGNSGSVPERLNAEILSRPELDSVALMTEPTLKAWGLPFDFLHTDDHVSKITKALAQAQERSSPTVLLVTHDMT